jgi:glutathione S-transferase
MAAGEHRRADYLAVHPLGQVPALTDGKRRLIESGAICAYLADRYGAGRLAPPLDSPLRGPYQQWLYFLACTLEPPVLEYLETRDGDARAAFDRVAAVLADGVGQGPYLLGEGFSAADVVVGSVLGWARGARLLDGHERLRDYGRRWADAKRRGAPAPIDLPAVRDTVAPWPGRKHPSSRSHARCTTTSWTSHAARSARWRSFWPARSPR